jgi:hypothetical protein
VPLKGTPSALLAQADDSGFDTSRPFNTNHLFAAGERAKLLASANASMRSPARIEGNLMG